MREVPMRDERLEVNVTFDERRSYVATAPELRQPVLALSLGGVRRRVEALMPDDASGVRLVLDRAGKSRGPMPAIDERWSAKLLPTIRPFSSATMP
jgi:hypothetical protein